jgi:hypothetical protein
LPRIVPTTATDRITAKVVTRRTIGINLAAVAIGINHATVAVGINLATVAAGIYLATVAILTCITRNGGMGTTCGMTIGAEVRASTTGKIISAVPPPAMNGAKWMGTTYSEV